MILDGEAYPLGDSVVPFTTVFSPARRIRSLAFSAAHTGIVFSHAVAAWIHGCGRFPGRIDLTIQAHHRFRLPDDPRIRIRRFRLHFATDTEIIAGARVTTPLRTALQLITETACDREAVTSAALLAGGMGPLRAELKRSNRIMHQHRLQGFAHLTRNQPLVTL